jgi:hypothetical protein
VWDKATKRPGTSKREKGLSDTKPVASNRFHRDQRTKGRGQDNSGKDKGPGPGQFRKGQRAGARTIQERTKGRGQDNSGKNKGAGPSFGTSQKGRGKGGSRETGEQGI